VTHIPPVHLERVRRLALKPGFCAELEYGGISPFWKFGAIPARHRKDCRASQVIKENRSAYERRVETYAPAPGSWAKMLEGVDHLKAAVPYVLNHHEWWNGSGYPGGLMGRKFPREGRLLAIADALMP